MRNPIHETNSPPKYLYLQQSPPIYEGQSLRLVSPSMHSGMVVGAPALLHSMSMVSFDRNSLKVLTISLQNREGLGAALLNKTGTSTGRECGRLRDGGRRDRDCLRAVDERCTVVSDNSQLRHRLL